ncbi:TrpB-like pyridoxal phosphate-dependent enzyme [Kibdelosporangium phytohabitans]|uniref:Tryptophan synthase beta chain n=1 Tax=Kibdelosporangium phytohabitans TaxID=860235 RepID=A0A0N9I3A5_9PSEU|nr:TrpB-like pyridoxal phosphate-dependent enzyme [Kibdelosporangium phytohabitans]ALG09242.1 tryptophan synthase subunit beta [Kibdelosporangium phytohabitans]MBE1469518.1 tryptophan synthase beta chain [Kibdelosporangium phytohabitans]
MTDQIKYVLGEQDIPRTWYNLAADLPGGAPHLHPGTGAEVTVDDLVGIMPVTLAEQELTREAEIEIPEPVRQIYAQWRPSPLFRARRLERVLNTPARIYYKYEGGSPAGSHKPNTAIAQAYYNKQAGVTRLATETGAGQWGSSLSLAGALFGLDVTVYMVKVSYHQKPYRRMLMETYGARCVPSPSTETAAGRAILAEDPDCPGSLGIATSEAIEVAAGDAGTNYGGGSVLNHVLLHQTVIGQEAIAQFALADDYPDIVIGCTGGGSNFGGLTFPFLGEQLRGGRKVRVIAAEPESCPTMTRGSFAYDFGDTAGLTPLLKMHTLGHSFMPPPVHAGGLRYHGMAPLVSEALDQNLIEAAAVNQLNCFASGIAFARSEGIVPAPESTHAIEIAVREAIKCREENTSRTILFGLSGHGHFDLGAYEAYLSGSLRDEALDPAVLSEALAKLPGLVDA